MLYSVANYRVLIFWAFSVYSFGFEKRKITVEARIAVLKYRGAYTVSGGGHFNATICKCSLPRQQCKYVNM
jgi:hypothetical protein